MGAGVRRELERRGVFDATRQRLNLHGEVPEIADLLRTRELGNRLESALGPDILVFETNVGRFTSATPGPRWHRHLYPDWEPQPSASCVARIAFDPEPDGHCHRFIPRHVAPDTASIEDIDPTLAVSVPLQPGEFVLFDGAMLHCAGDTVDGRAPLERMAFVVRVATPAQRLGDRARTGQCILLRGRDPHGRNVCGRLAASVP